MAMATELIKLYSFWRSSACYRVRIALNLKGIAYETLPIHLVRDGGEQHTADFNQVNPQELIPVLLHGDRVLRQSLAIIEYVDEVVERHPLLPSNARDRQRVRAISQLIACDIHPLGNLRVQQYLETHFGADQSQRDGWARHWIHGGFVALEKVLRDNPSTGAFCEGDTPTMADCCLIPQVYNALRFGVDMKEFPTIARINGACLEMPAVDAARPEMQADAPAST
jgi:maleylacetoacetate isomerase